MCFHSKQSKKAQEIAARFKVQIPTQHQIIPQENINGFTFPKTPVISSEAMHSISMYQWGLIPAWAKDNSIQKYTLNAKIETLAEKPSFKNVTQNRCLVVADGFYEWQWLDPKGKKKQKHLITLPDNNLFAFGGIWSEWIDIETGEIINTYAIVTTEANSFMSEIHNSKKRMPVMLSPENEILWLEGAPIFTFKNITLELKAKKIQ